MNTRSRNADSNPRSAMRRAAPWCRVSALRISPRLPRILSATALPLVLSACAHDRAAELDPGNAYFIREVKLRVED